MFNERHTPNQYSEQEQAYDACLLWAIKYCKGEVERPAGMSDMEFMSRIMMINRCLEAGEKRHAGKMSDITKFVLFAMVFFPTLATLVYLF